MNIVSGVAFSPDGRFILTRTDHLMFVCEAATGHLVAAIRADNPTEAFVRARFSPDGRSLATVHADGSARLWRLDADNRSTEDWLGYIQLHTGHRIDATGGLTPLSAAELETLWLSPRINPGRALANAPGR